MHAAFRHLKALTVAGQVLVISPGVLVEATRRAGSLTVIDPIVSRLDPEDSAFADGRRAGVLLRGAAAASAEPQAIMGRISAVGALTVAMAERLSGIVYTSDPSDMDLLRQAGARVVIERIPF